MRRRSRTSWLVSSIAALVLAAPAAAQPFSSLTFFGDSFTDTGNGDILAMTFLGVDLTPSPPYAPGRASNGPIWTDYLSTALGQPTGAVPSLLGGRNFAIGTARTGLAGGNGLPVGMLSQLGMYATSGQAPDPTGLYALFGGSLDVFDAAQLGTPAAQLAAIDQAASNVAFLTSQLYLAGARSFLVPSIANVGLTPSGRALGAPAVSLLGTLTMQYNALLADKLAFLSATLPGSHIFGLRLDNLYTNILADAAAGGPKYGLTNTTVPCFLGGVSCATSVFVDDLHPTTAAHQLIAQAAYDRVVNGVDIAAVPEPATLALVAGGLGVLGVVARRRRAA